MPGWNAALYGMDPLARQMAQAALQAAGGVAAQVVGRLSGCRLGCAVTGPAIVLGRSLDVPVVWTEPFPGPYRVEAVAGPGLAGASTLAVVSQTSTGCVVRVTATVAVAAGAAVLAHATW